MMKFTKVDDKSFYKEHMPFFWAMLVIAIFSVVGLWFLSQGWFHSLGVWGPSVAIDLGMLAIIGFFAVPLGIAVHGPTSREVDSRRATSEAAAETMSQRYGGEFTRETVQSLLGKQSVYVLTDGLNKDDPEEGDEEEDWYGPIVPVTFGNITKNLRLANREGQWILVDVTGLRNYILDGAPELEPSRVRA